MDTAVKDLEVEREAARGRTFAIISHPDAGKTTLTEKFLLYGGAVQLAGSVTSRKKEAATASDWMELERKRGISVSSTVLRFDYGGFRINLLDTPGHRDFSEDTYRVLTAVDGVVMVIDAAKGIEDQTRKLFEVCRRRGVPIFTFFNKLDRHSREPLALVDEIESALGLPTYAMNWPVGGGPEFQGVLDRNSRAFHFFETTEHGSKRAPVKVLSAADLAARDDIDTAAAERAREELEILEGVGPALDREAIAAGELSPAFFGSARNNFGVQLLLDGFLGLSSPPRGRRSGDAVIEPGDPSFSGFVFKIQANMDPKHRDRIAFVRVVSGRFERDMAVPHPREPRKVRLGNSRQLFGRERETVDVAYPGDVIGLVGNDDLRIGDTLAEKKGVSFDEIPRFAPETFAYLHNPNPSDYKRFQNGLQQLLAEGVVQHYERPDSDRKVALLGAVGPLQFEVVRYRLEAEYNAQSRLEPAPWSVARWARRKADGAALTAADVEGLSLNTGVVRAVDDRGRQLFLFPDEYSLRFFEGRNEKLELSKLPFDG